MKRLQSASGKNWGETYTYDGYGNLTQMNPTGTAGAPSLGVTVALDSNNVPTNRIAATGVSYDNNGNQTAGLGGVGLAYDVANRVSAVTGGQGPWYAYDSDNRRIYRQDASGTETIYFYGVDGKKVATYTIGFTKTTGYLGDTDYTMQLNYQSSNVYFAGRMICAEGSGVTTDRLGSVRNGGVAWPGSLGYQAQYPYGVEYTPQTVNDREKYATYTRDSVTGLDYAVNRYYSSQWGRFLSPDRSWRSARLGDPQSWNRYGYATNDPVNRNDPSGLNEVVGDPRQNCSVSIGDDGDEVYNCNDSWGTTGTAPPSVDPPVPDPEPPPPDPPESRRTRRYPPDPPDPPAPPPPLPCPPKYEAWINAHGTDAASVAGPIGTTEADILALSAYESGWGGGRFARCGAYFDLEVAKPKKGPNPPFLLYSNGWEQALEPNRRTGRYVLVAAYSSYLNSAESFAYYKGALFTNVTDPTTFGTIASQNGFGISVGTFVSIADVFVQCLH